MLEQKGLIKITPQNVLGAKCNLVVVKPICTINFTEKTADVTLLLTTTEIYKKDNEQGFKVVKKIAISDEDYTFASIAEKAFKSTEYEKDLSA